MRNLQRLFLVGALALVSVTALAQGIGLIEPWGAFLTMPTGSKIHDLAYFIDPRDGDRKLVIAEGSGQSEGEAVIRFYDGATHALTTEFQAPLNTYMGKPYWRRVLAFQGSLYAGLGNNTMVPPPGGTPTGQVWRFDGQSWQLVLQTEMNDVYSMCIYNGQLYAGTGRKDSKAGQLWVTSDGITWQFLRDFPSDFVRSLAVFQGQLYIGLKQEADLWSYDGATFTEHGAPLGFDSALSQIKTLVPSPDGSLLYVAGVPAEIYTWDGSTYQLSLDARSFAAEIYKGTDYKGTIFFPTHNHDGSPSGGGSILRLINGEWSVEYTTPYGDGQIQDMLPYQGYIYAGGSAGGGYPTWLFRAQYN